MKRSRVVLTIAITLLLAIGCSSASKAPPVSQVAPPNRSDVTTIRLAMAKGTEKEMTELLIPAFQAKYEQYQVELVLYQKPDELWDLTHKDQADVVDLRWLTRQQIPAYTAALDAYLAKSRFDVAPYGNLMNELQVQGRTYDLPYSADFALFVYSEEAIKAAGVTIPTDAWTWDQFRAAVAGLPRTEGGQKVAGLETIFHEDLLRLWVDGKSGKPVWEAEFKTLREAIGFFHTMIFTDKSMVPAPAYVITERGIDSSYSYYPFAALRAGQAAMTYEPRVTARLFPYLIEQKWNIAPMPSVPGARPILPVDPLTLGIATGSSQPDAAWDFIAFACGPEGAAVLARAGYPPAYRNDTTRQAWAAHQPAYPPSVESIWAATWRAYPDVEQVPAERNLRWSEFKKAQNWALSGRKTLDDALGWFTANEGGS